MNDPRDQDPKVFLNWARENPLDALRLFIEQRKRQDEKEDSYIISSLSLGEIPTPKEVQYKLSFMLGTRRRNLMKHHVYWEEAKLKEGLEALFRSAHSALVDIAKHDAAISSLSRDRRYFRDSVDHVVSNPTLKDVIAFTNSCMGAVDTVRRIQSRRPDLAVAISDLTSKYFRTEQTAFVKDLRKNLFHGSVVFPSWQVRGIGKESHGIMKFDKDDLVSFGEWTSDSINLIKGFPDGSILLSEVFIEYFEDFQNFYNDIKDLFFQYQTAAETDYYNILDAGDQMSANQHGNLLVNQIATGRDPYLYLHRFFKPDEVRQILRLPMNSKEQVNYMLSLRAVQLGFDPTVRSSLYRIFNVKDD